MILVKLVNNPGVKYSDAQTVYWCYYMPQFSGPNKNETLIIKALKFHILFCPIRKTNIYKNKSSGE
jgi:hypothetical protein